MKESMSGMKESIGAVRQTLIIEIEQILKIQEVKL